MAVERDAISSRGMEKLEDRHLLQGLGLRAGHAMFLFALIVGLSAGLAAFVYFWMTEAAVRALVHMYQRAPGLLSRTLLILSPAVGGLLTGYIFHWFAPDAKGGGVPEVIDALLHKDGFIRLRVGLFKALASVICIGSGGSTGREGPVVQIGASVGSALAQVFRITRRRAQLLVACGAAAGIAAVFNAPIAGAFFAAEVIIGSFAMRDLTLLFTASACSMVVARSLLWNHAAFPTPDYTFHVGPLLFFHLLLGILTALAGYAFIDGLHRMEHAFRHSRIPEPWRPAIGGLLLGILGVALGTPQVFGTSAEFMEKVFNGSFFSVGSMTSLFTGTTMGHLIAALLVLMVAKMLATSFTLGSGGAGGDLMPAMFIGGMLGGAYGLVIHHFFPAVALPPAAFALVGALGVFAAIAHAPVTAIILGIEATYHYGLVLPLIMCCSTSALLSSWLRTSSVYLLKLQERGIDVQSIRNRRAFAPDPLERVRVEDVMTRDFGCVPPDLPVSALLEEFARTSHHGFVVLDEDRSLVGVVTLSDAQRAIEDSQEGDTVEHIMTPASRVITCSPYQSLKDVLAKLGAREVGRLPVLDPRGGRAVIGVLRRGDILRGTVLALSGATTGQAPETLRGGRLVGIDLSEDDHWVGQSVAELEVPTEVILVALRRGNSVIIPNGATLLEPGDHITAFVQAEALEDFHSWRAAEPV